MAKLSDFVGGGGSLAELPVSNIGQTSSNQTLDLSQASVFELEPTADIEVDVTGLASGARARGFLTITAGGSQTLTWKAGGSTGNFKWNGGSAPTFSVGGSGAAFNVVDAVFNQSLDVSSQDTPQSVTWNDDGSKMYIIGADNDNVYEYDVTTPFDVGTASFSQSLDFSGQGGSPKGMTWNDDGSKMYIIGADNDNVYEYDVTTKFDISTASFSKSFSVGSQDGLPTGMTWNDDGSKMYIIGDNSDNVYEYDLTTPFDVGTASFSKSFDIGGQDGRPQGVKWNNDGSKMYMVGKGGDKVYEYDVTTLFDIGTASFSQSLDVSSRTADPLGMNWNNNGSKMYIADAQNTKILEYALVTLLDVVSFQQDGSGEIIATRIAASVGAS